MNDVVNDIENAIGHVGDIFKNIANANLDNTTTFNINIGTEGKRTNIIDSAPKNGSHLVINCVDCFIIGKFKVAGRLSVENFVLKTFTVGASPQDFRAKMVFEAGIDGQIAALPSSLNLTKEIDIPPPIAGFSIDEILNLGLIIRYEVGVQCTLNGAANFTFGLGATLPNTAIVAIDLVDPSKTKATGFDGSTFDPVFDIRSGSATLTVVAVSRPKLTFGIEVVNVGKLEAALKLGLPILTTQLIAVFGKMRIQDQDFAIQVCH